MQIFHGEKVEQYIWLRDVCILTHQNASDGIYVCLEHINGDDDTHQSHV